MRNNNKEETFTILTDGHSFGENSIYSSCVNQSDNVETMTDSHFGVIHHAVFNKIVNEEQMEKRLKRSEAFRTMNLLKDWP